MHPKAKQIIGFAGCFFVTFTAAAIGTAASIQAATFYAQLNQPAWAPPAAVFGPVWTILYVLMAISAWLIWRQSGIHSNRAALSLFLIQLVLNALWSWLFFAWHLGALAFVDITLLWLFILFTLIAFWQRNRLAGLLFLPYLAWVSFAAVLNYTIWQLNPQLLG